jgi:hypothetical protein
VVDWLLSGLGVSGAVLMWARDTFKAALRTLVGSREFYFATSLTQISTRRTEALWR